MPTCTDLRCAYLPIAQCMHMRVHSLSCFLASHVLASPLLPFAGSPPPRACPHSLPEPHFLLPSRARVHTRTCDTHACGAMAHIWRPAQQNSTAAPLSFVCCCPGSQYCCGWRMCASGNSTGIMGSNRNVWHIVCSAVLTVRPLPERTIACQAHRPLVAAPRAGHFVASWPECPGMQQWTA
jgi:hypothetical protein